MRSFFLLLITLLYLNAEQVQVSSRFYSIGTKAIERECDSSTTLFIPTYRGFSLYEIPLNASRNKQQDSRKMSVKRIGREKGFDLLVEPLFWFQFGRFDDPVESAVGIIPRLRLYLWRGAMFDSRSYITFRDELNTSAGYNGGTAVFSQVIKPFTGQWYTGSFGWFTRERWGVDVAWQGLFLDNKLLTEIQGGVTGGLGFRDSLFQFTKLDRFTGTVTAGYLLKKYKLLIELEAGYYLNKDFGGGGTLKRRFGLFDIALTGLYTELGVNGGFSISAPLWFGKHPQVRNMRFGLNDIYTFQYRFKGYNPPADRYDTKVDLTEKLWEFNPIIIDPK